MASADKLCASLAGPFRNIKDESKTGLLYLLFLSLSVLITFVLRLLVLGYCFSPLPLEKENKPTTPRCTQCEHCHILCCETKSSNEALLAVAKARLSHTPSIPRFTICTSLAAVNIFMMVLLAFSTQSQLYCGQSSYNRESAFALWFIYALSATWASNGTLCWAIWVRNRLGGPEAAERWPIRQEIGGIILISPLILAFAVPYAIVKLFGLCLCGIPIDKPKATESEGSLGSDGGIDRGEEGEK